MTQKNPPIDMLTRILQRDGAVTINQNEVNDMRHAGIVIKSGPYTLQKMTKTQVLTDIRHNKQFHGFLCGNRVRTEHIAAGYQLGVEIDVTTSTAFTEALVEFETSKDAYAPATGDRTHFYKIVPAEERNKELRKFWARKNQRR